MLIAIRNFFWPPFIPLPTPPRLNNNNLHPHNHKMAPYDSDDSLDDDQSYTETDVLLGYASKDSNGETISKLGGRPVRFPSPSFLMLTFLTTQVHD